MDMRKRFYRKNNSQKRLKGKVDTRLYSAKKRKNSNMSAITFKTFHYVALYYNTDHKQYEVKVCHNFASYKKFRENYEIKKRYKTRGSRQELRRIHGLQLRAKNYNQQKEHSADDC